MRKAYDKKTMSELLSALSTHLSAHVGQFPGIAVAVVALADAARDPTVRQVQAKAEKEPAKPKPVALSYEGSTVLVTGLPWGSVGVALKNAFNRIVGKQSKTINPETGEPFFLSCYDKKNKGFRIPKEKEPEIRQAIEAAGLPIA